MAKKKKKIVEKVELRNVILSFPNFAGKQFKGKMKYDTDVLLETDDPQVKMLRIAIKKVCKQAFGEDKTEWPEKIPQINDGDERQEHKGYAGRLWIKTTSNYPVEVVDPKGEPMTPEMIRGGTFADVAIDVSTWNNDGEEGVSFYLAGAIIDTKKPALNFGGGESMMSRFKRDGVEESDQDEEDEEPKKKKKAPPAADEDESDDSDSSNDDDDEDEEYTKPKKKKSKPSYDDDDDDED